MRAQTESYPANLLAFRKGKQRIRHTFEDQTYRDLLFKSHDMSEERMEVEELGIRGTNSSFRAAGINIVINRRWGEVLGQYILISAVLALTAISSLFLSRGSSRSTLTSSLILSSVFVIITAVTSTPHAEVKNNSKLRIASDCYHLGWAQPGIDLPPWQHHLHPYSICLDHLGTHVPFTCRR